MSEETKAILFELECLNQKLDFLIEKQGRMSRNFWDIVMLRADKISLELKMIELQSSIRKLMDLLG